MITSHFYAWHCMPAASFHPWPRLPTELKVEILRYYTYCDDPINHEHTYAINRLVSLHNTELVHLALEACKCTWLKDCAVADCQSDYTCNTFVLTTRTRASKDSTQLHLPPAMHRKSIKRLVFLMNTNIYDHADAKTFFLFVNDPWRFLFAPRAELFNSRRAHGTHWYNIHGCQLDFGSLDVFELRLPLQCVCWTRLLPFQILEQSLTKLRTKKIVVQLQVGPYPYQDCACANMIGAVVADIFRQAV